MDAVVFDLDGVVLEETSLRGATGMPVEEMATEKALEESGISDLPEGYLEASRWSYGGLLEATETYDLDVDPKEVWSRRERYLSEMEREYIRSGERNPCDDIDVLERLAAESIPVGIASNARHSTVTCVVEQFELDSVVTATRGQYVDPDDCARRKPNPDYITEVLERTGADTGVYVGDRESDIVAADRAGVDSAFIRRPHNDTLELDHRPTYELETLYDLLDIVGGE